MQEIFICKYDNQVWEIPVQTSPGKPWEEWEQAKNIARSILNPLFYAKANPDKSQDTRWPISESHILSCTGDYFGKILFLFNGKEVGYLERQNTYQAVAILNDSQQSNINTLQQETKCVIEQPGRVKTNPVQLNLFDQIQLLR